MRFTVLRFDFNLNFAIFELFLQAGATASRRRTEQPLSGCRDAKIATGVAISTGSTGIRRL